MPGMALRMAASITVAPFSTSMVRVSPVWSTKLILAMVLVLPVEEVGSPITGRSGSRQRPARIPPGRPGRARSGRHLGSGTVEQRVDRGAGLLDAVIEHRQSLRGRAFRSADT